MFQIKRTIDIFKKLSELNDLLIGMANALRDQRSNYQIYKKMIENQVYILMTVKISTRNKHILLLFL
jgi:hypothetical protein